MAAKSRTMAQQKTKEAYCFIVPAFIYMILVLGYPIVYNIILSLKDVNVKNLKSGTSVFVGLQNYIDLFHDPTFLLVLRNTFIFTIACLIFQFTIGFAFAMFFNQKFKLAGPIRGLILVSYMMPMAVTGLLGKNIFSNAGLINDLLGKIGISGPEWLVNTSTALIAVIIMNCWVGIPYTMLQVTGVLQNVPSELYEAAKIDGANAAQIFFKITLPYIMFIMGPYIITQFTGNINNFNVIYLLSAGKPTPVGDSAGKTDLLVTWLYKLTIDNQEYNIGAVIGILTFIVLSIVALVTYRNTKSYKDEEGFM